MSKTPDEMLEPANTIMEKKMIEAVKDIEEQYGGRVHVAAFVVYLDDQRRNSGMQCLSTFGDVPHGWFDVAQAASHEALSATAHRMADIEQLLSPEKMQ